MTDWAIGWVASTFFLAGILVGIAVTIWFLFTFVFGQDGGGS